VEPVDPVDERDWEIYRAIMERDKKITALRADLAAALAQLAEKRKRDEQDCMVNEKDGRCMVHGYCDGNKKHIERLRAAVEWACNSYYDSSLPEEYPAWVAELRRRAGGGG